MSEVATSRRRKFQSAKNRTEPIVVEFDPDEDNPKGRTYVFPGDVDAGPMLDYLENHAGDDPNMTLDDLPPSAAPAFFRIVMETQWETLMKPSKEGGLTMTEMVEVLGYLLMEYGIGDGPGAAVAAAEAREHEQAPKVPSG